MNSPTSGYDSAPEVSAHAGTPVGAGAGEFQPQASQVPTPQLTGCTLVTGGARSGKSRFAEQLLAGRDVDYVATSARNENDPEWMYRISLHVAARPSEWLTVETIDLVEVLGNGRPQAVLIDCLGVWLTRIMDDAGVWEQAPGASEVIQRHIDELVDAFRTTPRTVVTVTNEVGSGIVPGDKLTRYYRDTLGRLNQQVAAVCDDLWLCVSGIPLHVKDSGSTGRTVN